MECPRRTYSQNSFPISTAFSNCEEGIYRTRATIDFIHTAGDRQINAVDLGVSEGACIISFDVSQPVDAWTWLVEGSQLDLSLWDTGGDTRGGDPLWMVLRDPVTGDPLLSIYQLNGFQITSGSFRDELGIEAEIVGPVCKDSAALEDGLLVHVHDLRFSAEGKRITLGQMSEGSLPSSHASLAWRIQTGVLKNNLLDPNSSLLDVRRGEFFQIVAWTEPR